MRQFFLGLCDGGLLARAWQAHGAPCVADNNRVLERATRGAACHNRYHQVFVPSPLELLEEPPDMSESANRSLPTGMLALG